MEQYEVLEVLSDEDLEIKAFAWTNKTKQATECGSSCADSCCCQVKLQRGQSAAGALSLRSQGEKYV